MIRRRIVSALAVSAIALTSPLSATAAEDADTAKLQNGGTVNGGTAQAEDPTRFDYVPAGVADAASGETDAQVGPLSAKGYAFIPAFNYTFEGVTIPVPGAQIFHNLNGSGLHIDNETATYTVPANICNYRFDYQNRDLTGNIVPTHSTGDHIGCQFGMVGDQGVSNLDVQTGMMCARLFVSGEFRGEQCHHVYP